MNWGNFGSHILKVSSVQSIYILCVQNFILKNPIFRSIKIYFENHSRIFSIIFTLSIFKQILRDEIEKGVFVCRIGNCFFKYVVENESDIPEIKKFVTKYNIPENRVQLMTQASTKEEISMKEKSISELAKLHNFSFSPRLHVAMWGSQRGK